MDAEHRGEVFRLRNSLTWFRFAIRDCSSDLGSYLFVKIKLIGAIDRYESKCRLVVLGWPDRSHNDTDSSVSDNHPYTDS
jgi:hypothetical protein